MLFRGRHRRVCNSLISLIFYLEIFKFKNILMQNLWKIEHISFLSVSSSIYTHMSTTQFIIFVLFVWFHFIIIIRSFIVIIHPHKTGSYSLSISLLFLHRHLTYIPLFAFRVFSPKELRWIFLKLWSGLKEQKKSFNNSHFAFVVVAFFHMKMRKFEFYSLWC